MPEAESTGKLECVVAAKVIRADGTEEDLGVISVTSAEAEAAITALREIVGEPAEPAELTLEQVNALHAKRSEENDAASEKHRRADHEAHRASLPDEDGEE